uniref:NADH-ubiquinone oxidoreductase chain 3 n=1 Tax=Bombus ignitus TaxID=130704 RepID=A4UAI0_BOMIG|nr:NADH dehydrogenase subunit 3 [Bombus ignitus]
MYLINILIYFMIILIIIFIIFILNKFLSMTKKMNFEKNLPYECGFNPITKMNLPFSLPFYLISLTFLIFDIEIILLIPLISFIKTLNYMYMYMMMIFFFYNINLFINYKWFCSYLNWMY